MLGPLATLDHALPMQAPGAGLMFAQDEPWLESIFGTIHYLHKFWRWQRDVQFVYHYFQHPALGLGELALGKLAQDNLWLQTAALVAQVICSAWQAELERQHMVVAWREFSWQMRHPKIIPFHTSCLIRTHFSLWAYWPKISLIFQLLSHVFTRCFCLSMHLLDITTLINDPAARQRANYHILLHMQFIFKQAQEGIQSAALASQGPHGLPVFEYLGIKSEILLKISSNLGVITGALCHPLLFGDLPGVLKTEPA